MVKSIIKRIIVGVGIALVLMALKDGGLIANAYALSCDVSDRTTSHPIDSYHGNIPNTTSGTNMDISYYNKNTYTDGRQRIYFNSTDSYIDVLVPITWTMSFTNSPTYTAQGTQYEHHIESSPPIFYLVSSGGTWTMGVWDNGFYRVRYFKSQFTNNYVELTQFKIGIPTWYYNYVSDAFVSVNGYVQVDHVQCDSNQALQNAINENTQAVEDVNNSINDGSTDDPTSDISTMNGKLASNNSITQLLTLPIQMYQNILNSVNGSCSSFSLGSLYNHNLTLPCINLQNLLGSTLYGIIDILISGLFILSFRKKMVDIFNHMTSLNDRGNELE